jgi:hypothetical protein
MSEASVEESELEEDACQTVETEQERLDRDGIYGEIKRELIKRGTASGSAPHAGSRDMAVDANGDLIEVDDGASIGAPAR